MWSWPMILISLHMQPQRQSLYACVNNESNEAIIVNQSYNLLIHYLDKQSSFFSDKVSGLWVVFLFLFFWESNRTIGPWRARNATSTRRCTQTAILRATRTTTPPAHMTKTRPYAPDSSEDVLKRQKTTHRTNWTLQHVSDLPRPVHFSTTGRPNPCY